MYAESVYIYTINGNAREIIYFSKCRFDNVFLFLKKAILTKNDIKKCMCVCVCGVCVCVCVACACVCVVCVLQEKESLTAWNDMRVSG